ncbi:MAG: hypothetical protein HY397_02210 [Candidatus Doudnabacteria bacterium]|nr:hypothetical protein [Candidatus Doudnabacteria bacterium]
MSKETLEMGDVNQSETPHFHFDEFAVDWPLNGNEHKLADDVAEATLKALNEGGDATTLSIGKDIKPRILRISDAISWFENAGYFSRKDMTIVTTEKWKRLFIKERG